MHTVVFGLSGLRAEVEVVLDDAEATKVLERVMRFMDGRGPWASLILTDARDGSVVLVRLSEVATVRFTPDKAPGRTPA